MPDDDELDHEAHPTDPDRTAESTRQADEADARSPHRADRPPTPQEAEAADEAARHVDPATAEHYREMARTGADVEGEGRVGG